MNASEMTTTCKHTCASTHAHTHILVPHLVKCFPFLVYNLLKQMCLRQPIGLYDNCVLMTSQLRAVLRIWMKQQTGLRFTEPFSCVYIGICKWTFAVSLTSYLYVVEVEPFIVLDKTLSSGLSWNTNILCNTIWYNNACISRDSSELHRIVLKCF